MASPVYANSLGTVRHNNTASTSYTADIPASVVTGDLMVANIITRSSSTISAVPTNWVGIPTNNGLQGNSMTQWVYAKVADASDTAGSTYVWTGTSAQTSVITSRITGADTTASAALHASIGVAEASGSTTRNFSAVTTTVADTLILNMICVATSGQTYATWSVGTERWDASTGSATQTRSMGGASGPVAAIGSTGTFTVVSGSNATLNHTVAIAPPAAAPTSLIIPTDTVHRILSRR